MKLGIMQPYFMPYIGYWQLLNAVDKYVIYDDVNYIKGGWINRNRILVNGMPHYFNLPVLGASPNKKINEIQVNNEEVLIKKNLRCIEAAYKKAPYYSQGYEILEETMQCKESNIAKYIRNSFELICDYLNIKTELIMSSELIKNNELKGQDKVLDICNLLKATEYYNAIGGQELYSFETFKNRGIELKFLKSNNIIYQQYENVFQDNLSIIDIIMFNSKTDIIKMLGEYSLISQ